jgi:peptidoglycan/xylan/chitin deacetylase (PgdA/CDA1 family)
MEDRVVFDGQKCLVEEMIREIDRRGWEIGLHPSWESSTDLDEMKFQKERLETVVGHEIVSVRQHFLHYSIQHTPRIHDSIQHTPRIHEGAGLRFDSTLGFNDNVGFRFGTCHPWRLYDLESDRRLSVVEVPLIVQDGALLRQDKGLRLDEDTALEYVLRMAGEVERVGGVLTLLWHADAIATPVWLRVYERALSSLRDRNPWFASVREIGEYWKKSQTAQ